MAANLSTTLLLLPIFFTLFCSSASAADCSSIVMNMADCLSFVQSGSRVEKPEGSCCSGLKTVLKTGPECLCESYKTSASMGITLNVTKALSLPHACNIVAPSAATKCQMSLPPAASPGASPGAAHDASSPKAAASAPKSSAGKVPEAPAPAPGTNQAASSPLLSVSAASSLTFALFLVLIFCF